MKLIFVFRLLKGAWLVGLNGQKIGVVFGVESHSLNYDPVSYFDTAVISRKEGQHRKYKQKGNGFFNFSHPFLRSFFSALKKRKGRE